MEPAGPSAPERLDAGPPPPAGNRRWLLVLVVAAFAAGLVASQVLGRTDDEPAARDLVPASRTPTPRPPVRPVPPTRTPTPTPSLPPAVVSSSRGFLDTLDLAVVVRSSGDVFRIDTRARRISRTRLPLSSDGQVSLVAAADRVLVRPAEDVPGYVIPRKGPARQLTGRLGPGAELLPGPSGRLWLIRYNDSGASVASFTDLDGRRVYARITMAGGGFGPDGAGGLLYSDVGGVYRVTPAGIRRITRGAIVAVGLRHFLVLDCDDRRVCSTFLLDRRTGQQRRTGPARTDQWPDGVVSPDGRYVALRATLQPRGTRRLQVVDTRSGEVRIELSDERVDLGPDARSLHWLRDGRLLTLHDGRLVVVDPRRRAVVRPDLDLPPLEQLTVSG